MESKVRATSRIERLRRRQIKNFLAVLLSLGTPMLHMGDEVRSTQFGNNNAYCQDNEMSWLDWSLLDRHRDLHRFVRTLIGHRRRMMGARSEESLELSLNELLRRAEFHWHGVRLGRADWADYFHSIACTIRSTPLQLPLCLHVMINAYWEALDFNLPPMPAGTLAGWRRWIDTARNRPRTSRTRSQRRRYRSPGPGCAALRRCAVCTNRRHFRSR